MHTANKIQAFNYSTFENLRNSRETNEPITCINLRASKLVKLDKLTGALLKSIQPVIDRWLFVKAMLRDNIAL